MHVCLWWRGVGEGEMARDDGLGDKSLHGNNECLGHLWSILNILHVVQALLGLKTILYVPVFILLMFLHSMSVCSHFLFS